MYVYQDYDQRLLEERVAQYRDQTRRYLAGQLSEDEFLALRLQNGLYIQRYAPMLRISVPYGMLASKQLRALGKITREYDKGFAHVSTRQNIQLNWPEVADVPDILAELAAVQMHAIQTSGNCIRNITTDELAGVRPDEVEDPRPWCEIIRQWSTFNPEFAYLPRKFKIAVNAVPDADPAVIGVHDIGVQVVHGADGETGFQVWAGGGLGRTPMVGSVIGEYVPWRHLLAYLEAILRVYNKYGNRDNKYKARIKILVKALGPEKFRELTEAEFAELKDGPMTLTEEEVARIRQCFTEPDYRDDVDGAALDQALAENRAFNRWYHTNSHAHKRDGYRAVTLTLKKTGRIPGDISDSQFEKVADLADRYSFGEVRNTHQQNMVMADVAKDDLFALWQELDALGFATPNLGLLTDIVACPGGDLCSLANAKSIPIAEGIQRRFDDLDFVHDLGALDINISGCMNACGHHHIGHIGILGVDKKGKEFYQITLGGRGDKVSRIGEKMGPSFESHEVTGVIEKIIHTYVDQRLENEPFIDTYERIGMDPFKESVYG
ncbi:MAG: nitrite/sulfite reductase [Alcanivorax sp.]|uniref:Nitrite/sulfite reductase n=1 Tax=Alloalcanivorax marinus TaxID=1177169 RepID=A0A9Q3UQR8_9GAMM|nr:nitrite/sulfite reductase [Alloalcanivorax marinus]MBM7335342.1 nitrite/sulfite reductase [Alloalcanivorax marinus]MCC4310376.1 nitrite/sulfite reductase [Alloalcanivorax marinus]MCU5785636.1 sulfite reductase [Alloalcanivorax marinus]